MQHSRQYPSQTFEKPHDVVGLQSRAVEAPALRVEDVSALVGVVGLVGLVAFGGPRLLWTIMRWYGSLDGLGGILGAPGHA